MTKTVSIGIIGDFDEGKPSHWVTVQALAHSAGSLSIPLEPVWVPTDRLAEGIPPEMDRYGGFWCAPGSPYRSTKGALDGIRYAREHRRPFFGS